MIKKNALQRSNKQITREFLKRLESNTMNNQTIMCRKQNVLAVQKKKQLSHTGQDEFYDVRFRD